jgi:hypothetical protein
MQYLICTLLPRVMVRLGVLVVLFWAYYWRQGAHLANTLDGVISALCNLAPLTHFDAYSSIVVMWAVLIAAYLIRLAGFFICCRSRGLQ